MPPTIILASLAVAAAIPVLWWAVAGTRDPRPSVARNLAAAQPVPTDMREALLARSATERAIQPLLRWFASQARRLTPAGMLDRLHRLIVLAGKQGTWPLERVLAAKLMLGLGGLGIGGLYLMDQVTLLRIFATAGGAILAFYLPDILMSRQARERQDTIQRELADTLDQITVSVEAGLGFEAAMARVGRTGDGPLADELIRTIQEIQIGVRRDQALRDLAERTTVTDLRQFVTAIVQAEEYGIPIAQVLRVQAGEQRVRRRQRAEERAMKIPVKVVFPLIFCILPALMVVILGPAIIRIGRALFGLA